MTTHNRFDENNIFSFKDIEKIEVNQRNKKLDTNTGSLSKDIPSKIMIEFDGLFAIFITENFNLWLNKGELP